MPRRRLVAHRGVVAEGRRASEGGRRVLHAVRRQHGRAADQQRRDEALRRVHLRGHQQRGLGLLQSQAHSTRSARWSDRDLNTSGNKQHRVFGSN